MRPSLAYIGFLGPDQVDIKSDLEETVYSHWDTSPGAPAKSRPVEPQPEPSLGFLTWSNGVARFPESAFQKFPEGSPHYPEPVEMKKKLVQEFPSPATVAATTPQSSQLGPQESPTSLLMEERNHSMSCVSWSWKLLRPMPCQLKGPLG